MQSNTLTELIKDRDGSVTKAAKKLGVKNRQTMYNYIKRYCDNQYEKIPEDVCKYFQKLEVKDGPKSVDEMEFIASLNEKEDQSQRHRAMSYMKRLAKEQIQDIEKTIEDVDSHFGRYVTDPETLAKRQKWLDSQQEDIKKLEEYIRQIDEEQKRVEDEFRSSYTHFSQNEESVDEKLRRLVERGGYGGPSWKGKDFGVLSICDNGEYMVIVDDIGLDSRDVKLYIYAIIGGRRTTIATYDFPNHNEKFVRFRLVPKLSYYFEVKSPCVDYPDYTSGILELTNDT